MKLTLMTNRLTNWPSAYLPAWLIDWLIIDWVINSLTDWLTLLMNPFLSLQLKSTLKIWITRGRKVSGAARGGAAEGLGVLVMVVGGGGGGEVEWRVEGWELSWGAARGRVGGSDGKEERCGSVLSSHGGRWEGVILLEKWSRTEHWPPYCDGKNK